MCRITLCFLFLLPSLCFSQVKKSGNLYRSTLDESLTLQKVAVLPSSDNLSGIYARPLEDHLVKLVQDYHHWDYVKAHSIGPVFSPADLEASPQKVKELGKYIEADAFLVGQVIKGPQGISILISLFLTNDGKLFSKQQFKNLKKFDLREMREQTDELFSKIKSSLPYNGLILSRAGTRVTLNIGHDDGVEKGHLLSVIQIIKVERHPKFHFIISTEKEILGKVKILKSEKKLSFGTIVTEIEKGAIQKHSKIAGLNFVRYGKDSSLIGQGEQQGLKNRPDSDISFGKNAKAWVPQKPPTFGQASARVGLGTFNYNLSQSTPLVAKSSFFPSLNLKAEVWLNPTLSMHAGIKQGIATVTNPTGSGLSKLGMAVSNFDFSFGYTNRMGGTVYGPKIELLAGFSSYKLQIDDVTGGLTSMTYSGVKLGLHGSFPITPNKIWSAGIELNMFLSPRLSESPGTSGSSYSNTINQFSLFTKKRIRANMQLIAGIDIELYSSKISGTASRVAATSASHSLTALNGGIVYLF